MEELMQFESEITENNLLKMDAPKEQSSYIKVLGVGGAGTNAVNHMYDKGIQGVDFIVCNTDQASLNNSPVANKIKIGEGGLGAGNDPEVARQAAEAAESDIKSQLEHNTRMLFITAGMGGGTGTGASPVIARFAKEVKIASSEEQILVVGVVTLPFSFEGRKRKTQAQEGIQKLKQEVDAIITINTDKLREYGDFTMNRAFAMADDILLTAAKGISEMMTVTGRVQVDFRDVQSVMKNSGVALMGTGVSEGENRALEAIRLATTSKLLNDNDISETKNILLYILSSSKEEYAIRVEEIDIITSYLEQATNSEVDYIWGMGTDDNLEDKLSITLVATGFRPQEMYTSTTRTPLDVTQISNPTPIPTPIPSQEQQTPTSVIDQIEIKPTPQQPIDQVQTPVTPSNQTQEQPIQKIVHTLTLEEEPQETATLPENNTRLTGIIQQPTMVVNEKPQATQPVETPTSAPINQITTDINELFANPVGREITFEERIKRMEKVREIMNTEEGLNMLSSTSPLDYSSMHLNQEFSQSSKASNMSVDASGQVQYTGNKILNACVD